MDYSSNALPRGKNPVNHGFFHTEGPDLPLFPLYGYQRKGTLRDAVTTDMCSTKNPERTRLFRPELPHPLLPSGYDQNVTLVFHSFPSEGGTL